MSKHCTCGKPLFWSELWASWEHRTPTYCTGEAISIGGVRW